MKAAAEHLWTMAITARRLLDEHINLEPTMQLNTGIVEKYWNRERGYRIADILCAFEKLASRFRTSTTCIVSIVRKDKVQFNTTGQLQFRISQLLQQVKMWKEPVVLDEP
ncbi:hypothetical protein V8E54_002439 [Elaphomyces granulatus]